MTGHFGFSYVGLLFLLLLFIPNAIWTGKKPQGYTSENENKILLFFENRIWHGTKDGTPAGDCDSRRGLRLFREHTLMGGHADRRAVHHGTVIYYDNVGVRQVF